MKTYISGKSGDERLAGSTSWEVEGTNRVFLHPEARPCAFGRVGGVMLTLLRSLTCSR